MTAKKFRHLGLCALLTFTLAVSVGCQIIPQGYFQEESPKVNYDGELEQNSPEFLAKRSSEIYRDMSNAKLRIADGFAELLGMTSQESTEVMRAYEKEFEKQIIASQNYLEINKDSVKEFKFGATHYGDQGTATIRRIQINASGNEYYFVQDFIQENGQWKIRGDNIENKFVIKRSLF